MIIKNVCLLLEALSIVFCLHYLYGEKFRLDIATVSYLSIHMIVMTAINYLELPKTYTIIMYPIFMFYCGVRFSARWKEIVANVIMCIILVGGLQMVLAFAFSHLWNIELFADMKLLLMNCISTFIVIFLLPKFSIKKLTAYVKGKSEIILVIVCTCVIMVLFLLINYKNDEIVEIEPLVLLFICIIFIFVLSGQMNSIIHFN